MIYLSMKKRKLFSTKKRKPSQRVLINLIIGTAFSIAMGIFIWLWGREIGPESYHIVLITLGVGMSLVLIPFVIVYFIMRKNEKPQERTKFETGLKTEEKRAKEQSAPGFTKLLNIPPSPDIKPMERACEYCGYEPVIEGKICQKCNKYVLIKNVTE